MTKHDPAATETGDRPAQKEARRWEDMTPNEQAVICYLGYDALSIEALGIAPLEVRLERYEDTKNQLHELFESVKN